MASENRQGRDPYLDNAKVILIMFVVVGHLLAVVSGSDISDAIYKWIYSFHMPAFVVITGYLSRSYQGSPRQVKALISGVLVPYLVFQVIIRVEPWLLFGEPLHLNIFTPAWSNWYLLAVFAWRLLVPVIRWVRFPLLASVLIVLMSVIEGGVDQGLSSARILSYLPFFVLGLTLTPQRLEAFKRIARRWLVRAVAAAYTAAVGIGLYLAGPRVPAKWFAMSVVTDIPGGLGNLQHIALRLAVLAFTASMFAAVLVLIPQRSMFFSFMGAATLTMYLLQEATLLVPRHYIAAVDDWSAIGVATLVIIGIGYALLLGSRPVQAATRWLVDPLGVFESLRRVVLKSEPAQRSSREADASTPSS